MSIVLEDFYSYKDPERIVPYGVSIADYGLTAWDAVDGYGLVTRGLLWQLYQIWFDSEYYAPITTSWANGNAIISTTWTDDNASVTTVWTEEYNFNGF